MMNMQRHRPRDHWKKLVRLEQERRRLLNRLLPRHRQWSLKVRRSAAYHGKAGRILVDDLSTT
jgi:hypothetical protein